MWNIWSGSADIRPGVLEKYVLLDKWLSTNADKHVHTLLSGTKKPSSIAFDNILLVGKQLFGFFIPCPTKSLVSSI